MPNDEANIKPCCNGCGLFEPGYTLGYGEVQSSSVSGGTSAWCMWLWFLTRWRSACHRVIRHKCHSLGSTHWHQVAPTSVSQCFWPIVVNRMHAPITVKFCVEEHTVGSLSRHISHWSVKELVWNCPKFPNSVIFVLSGHAGHYSLISMEFGWKEHIVDAVLCGKLSPGRWNDVAMGAPD